MQETWRWVNFSQRDGLPSTDILQIVESPDGTIWANTGDGVVWYDGFAWHQPYCLGGAKIESHLRMQPLDRDRILATGDRLPVIYSRTDCQPISFTFNGKSVRVTTSAPAADGKTIVQTNERNFHVWDGRRSALGAVVLNGTEYFGSPLSFTPGRPTFIAGKQGLLKLDPSGWSVALPVSTLPNPDHISATTVRAAADNTLGEGLFSVGFPQAWQGVWEWSKGAQPRRIPQSSGLIANIVAISRQGEAIVSFDTEDVWIKQAGVWEPLLPTPAPLRNARHVFFDSQDRLWVATSNGIHLLRSHRSDWSRIQFSSPNRGNYVHSLLSARDGKLWLGTSKGISIVHPNGRIEFISSVLGKSLSFVTALAQDTSGAIWCSSGAAFEGVYRYSDGLWRHFGTSDGLGATYYHNLHVDPDGHLWALSTGRGRADALRGVYRFDGVRFSNWDQIAGLKDPRAYAMASTADGTLWFASFSGISRFAKGVWTNWTTQTGLRPGAVFNIQSARQGGVYFVDRRNGLGMIRKDDTVAYEDTSALSTGRHGWSVVEDAESNLWVATRAGLALRRNGAWSNLAQADGLSNPLLWPLAFWRGHLCTGSDGGGLFCLDLDVLKRKPPVVSQPTARVDGATAQLDWRVHSSEDSSESANHSSRFRLNGGAWSPWQPASSSTLSGLSYGVQQVELQSRDRFGSMSAISAPLAFSISPPLWMQPVFLIPVGLSLIAALIAIYGFVSRTYKHNKQLAEKEESFRALIEYSSVGITLWDRNRRVFYVSPAVTIILGYETSELIGEFRPDLIHPDDRDSSNSRLSSLLETPGQTQRSRIRMKHKNGEYRWIEVISRNLFDNPAVGAIVTNLRDITDSTNAEIAAAEARQKAENANQAKSDFLAMISHEIRTPMNGITGMCQLLIESNLNREQQDYAETISYSAQSLLALINDVLDFSRIEAGKLTIERAPLDLAELLKEVAQLVRVRAEEKHLKLEVIYPKDAPRAFYGDALRIRQILFNLTGNAVKFTHEGGIRIEAAISYNVGSAFNLDITVKDTGIGIPEDKLQLVFQKFTQADVSTTRRYGGSGLGLSISQSLASLMGGSIDASSVVGEGSEFRLHLQLDAAPESTLQRKHSTVEALQPLSDSLEILLVEDNKVNQKLALRLLERLGCQARVAESGIEALELLDTQKFDLILMDCQMPLMDGYEATRRIREREHSNRHIPIVAITANAMESDLEKCLEAGMDSYLTKPIDFNKLRDALETWGIDYRGPRATSDPTVS